VDSRSKDIGVAMEKAIFLQAGTVKIFPAEAQAPDDNLRPDDFLRWMFTFLAKDLLPAKTYSLQLADDLLFNEAGLPVVLKTTHEYKMAEIDTKCSGNGFYNTKLNQCICNPGNHRTGISCGDCEPGFHEKDGACIRFEGCEANSCGCGPSSTPSHCEPLGTCLPSSDVNNPITCSCLSNKYTGLRCEKCSQGFQNHPYCTPNKCPACVHGQCVNTVCTCDAHWEGPACDRCAAGFSGSNCETEHGIAKVVAVILVLLIITGLIAFGIYYYMKNKKRQTEDFGTIANDDILLSGMGQKLSAEVGASDSEELNSSTTDSSDGKQADTKGEDKISSSSSSS